MTDSLTFAADDGHVHFRDERDGRLQLAAPATARQFSRGWVMPNLSPPVCTVEQALAYRKRILRYTGDSFEPLMLLYLTGQTSPNDIEAITRAGGRVVAVKYYPAGATTGSEFGVSNIRDSKVLEAIAAMQDHDIPLCLHGETADPAVDVFDREEEFMPDFFFLRNKFSTMRIVLEHITTEDAVKAVRLMQTRHGCMRLDTAATITPQHILINRNHMLGNGINPHDYCKPIAKREKHRVAVLGAATSGEACFFLGTDSAPHAKHTKENSCGCAGCYTGLHALELYAEAFDKAGKIDMLPDFAGKFGARFYGLNAPTKKIRLERQEWIVPAALPYAYGDAGHSIVPFYAGETLHWKMVD